MKYCSFETALLLSIILLRQGWCLQCFVCDDCEDLVTATPFSLEDCEPGENFCEVIQLQRFDENEIEDQVTTSRRCTKQCIRNRMKGPLFEAQSIACCNSNMCNGEVQRTTTTLHEDTELKSLLEGKSADKNSGPQSSSGISTLLLFVGTLAQIIWIIGTMLG
mmetsp:Transcript_28661/g.37563  ORF Transcript_28661/g.37563 Transcript_28661/m.37563 type:complete len:163 (-) Transcript_28661:179-667(-)